MTHMINWANSLTLSWAEKKVKSFHCFVFFLHWLASATRIRAYEVEISGCWRKGSRKQGEQRTGRDQEPNQQVSIFFSFFFSELENTVFVFFALDVNILRWPFIILIHIEYLFSTPKSMTPKWDIKMLNIHWNYQL